jgi:hypothetical protein
MSEPFWNRLLELDQILVPYCNILNKLQSDKARLYEVLHCYAYICRASNLNLCQFKIDTCEIKI